MDLWEAVRGCSCRAVFHEDNESMIRVVQTGKNPTMKKLHRAHRIALGTMHERIGNPETKDRVDIVHTSSEYMAAGIFTKGV